MPAVTVQISRFVDEHQPGFVECILMDALGESHLFVEKVPVVSTDDLWSTSSYPQPQGNCMSATSQILLYHDRLRLRRAVVQTQDVL
jgi:hypothetical protein